jgi:hypothetical protein
VSLYVAKYGKLTCASDADDRADHAASSPARAALARLDWRLPPRDSLRLQHSSPSYLARRVFVDDVVGRIASVLGHYRPSSAPSTGVTRLPPV